MLARSPMRRSGSLKRTPFRRRRPEAGKPRVKGRHALPVAEWRALVERLMVLAGFRCEVPWCRRSGVLDPHHIVKASHGGPDAESNVVIVCRNCHQATDLPRGNPRHLEVSIEVEFATTGMWRCKAWLPEGPRPDGAIWFRPMVASTVMIQ